MKEFTINCIKPERTLCDKISRQTRLSALDPEKLERELAKHKRPYDITLMLRESEISGFLRYASFQERLKDVIVNDKQKQYFQGYGLPQNAVIFKEPERILNISRIKRSYTDSLGGLVFPDSVLPSVDDVINAMHAIQKACKGFHY